MTVTGAPSAEDEVVRVDQMPSLRSRLLAGGTALGHLMSLPAPTAVRAMAAGSDFLVIDTEHSMLGAETVATMIMATAGTGCAPLLRIPDTASSGPDIWIRWALDAGAAGICVPHVSTAEQAREVVAAAHYPPIGRRGLGPSGAMLRWGLSRPEYIDAARTGTVVCLIVESIEALDELPEIVDTPGVDVIWIARGDLAASMGLMGQENHPDVWEAAAKIEAIVAPSSVALGELSRSNQEAAELARRGYQLLCLGGDVGYMVAGAQVRSQVARTALAGRGADDFAAGAEGHLVDDGRCEAIDVSIVVSSSEAGLGFYRDLLGMQHIEDVALSSGDLLHRLRVGRSELKLLVPTSTPGPAVEGWKVCGPSYVTLRVDNIEEIAMASGRRGVKVIRPLSVLRPGTEVLILEDPDGTHVEFKRVAA